MLKFKSYPFLLSALLLMIILSSCGNTKKNTHGNRLNSSINSFDTILTLKNNIVYGYRFDEIGECEFLTYDVSESKLLTHGKTSDFRISTDSFTFINDTIYIPIASNDKSEEYNVDLYSFNNQSLYKKESIYTNMSPLVYLDSSNDFIILLNSDADGDQLITTLDIYDIKMSNTKTIITNTINIHTQKGSQILAFDYNQIDHCIYVLFKDNISGIERLSLNIYNAESFELTSSLDFTEIMPDITSQPIASFNITGDHLYLRNFSDDAIYAEIDDGKIIPIIIGDYEFQLIRANEAVVSKNNMETFFLRENSLIIFQDSKQNNLKCVDISEYGKIINLYKDKDTYLIRYYDDSNNIRCSILSDEDLKDNSNYTIQLKKNETITAESILK